MNSLGTRDAPLLVVGAGIAGLTCALAFSRAGFRTIVCEKARTLEAVGAGLQLSANALSVLDRLGLKTAITQAGFPARTVALRDGATDRLLARVPVESGADGYVAVHRADLQAILLDAVRSDPQIELRLGRSLQGMEERATSVCARFVGPDGDEDVSDTPLLVGADGVWSTVASLLGSDPPVDSGLVAHRLAIADAPGEEIEAWLSPASHAVSYPMRRNGERNLVVVEKARRGQEPIGQGWNTRLSDYLTRGRYLGCWPLVTVDPDQRLRLSGRTVLVGDAAHAMFPFAAQGAAMALEDAWVLARSLAMHEDHASAMSAYHDARKPRIDQVLKRVRFHRFVYHLPWPLSAARNIGMKLRPSASMRQDLAWLYDWRADGLPGGI